MIPKKNRFPMRTDFLEFKKKANKLTSSHLILYHHSSPQFPRLAVVVPKKLNKRATARNRIKRILKYRLLEFIDNHKTDLVLVLKPIKLEKGEKTEKILKNELKNILQQID